MPRLLRTFRSCNWSMALQDIEYAIGSREAVKRIFMPWIVAHVIAAISMYFLLTLHIAGEIYYGLRWLP